MQFSRQQQLPNSLQKRVSAPSIMVDHVTYTHEKAAKSIRESKCRWGSATIARQAEAEMRMRRQWRHRGLGLPLLPLPPRL